MQAVGRCIAAAVDMVALTLAASLFARPATASGTTACVGTGSGPTTLIADGNLHVVATDGHRRPSTDDNA